MKRKRGNRLIKAGLLMILIAVGLTAFNILDSARAEKKSAEILEQISKQQIPSEEPVDFYMSYSEIPMAEVTVDDISYIGVLDMPALGLSLPVAGESSKAALRKSPCRYSGSVYSRDLIISGHNYRDHFGSIKRLQPGDEITFTDNEGNRFDYTVQGLEVIDGNDVETMISGEWDLTLYTCTIGGKSRVTVRAEMDPVND